jgi:GntR family transcriptional regulator
VARDSDAVYQRIADEIAARIESGDLKNGDRLPTRPELEEHYGVSRQVVQNALNLLHYDGYLTSQSSKGTFVTRPPRLTLPMWAFEQEERNVDAFNEIVIQAGHTPSQDIKIGFTDDPAIRDQLDVPNGQLVLVRRRVRSVDGVRYALSDSYFPHEKVKGSRIADAADITEGGRHILTGLNVGMATHRDSIVARRPSGGEVRDLGIAPGCAVIAHNRLSSTAEGAPIRLLATVLPSDRWEITYADLGG